MIPYDLRLKSLRGPDNVNGYLRGGLNDTRKGVCPEAREASLRLVCVVLWSDADHVER